MTDQQALRNIQNKMFGLARNVKGIQTDIKHRHQTRANTKLNELRYKTDQLWTDIHNLENTRSNR